MKTARPRARVYFRSLGCPKNQLDSEVMLAQLSLGGYLIAQEIRDAALAARGVRELNVISQDTTSYRKDLYGRPCLAELIHALDEVESLDWVRLLYLYPSALDDGVMEALAGGQRVLPYVDMPRQRRLIEKLRARVSGMVLRTTFIVGFPGETEEDFAEGCAFVGEFALARVPGVRDIELEADVLAPAEATETRCAHA